MSRLAAFVRLGRPKFLFQSMLVVAMGVTFAIHDGHPFEPRWYVVTWLFGWCIHLMTHYCNEYFDLDADRANATPTSWTGGSRVLVSGLLAPQVSLAAAFVLLFAGIGLIASMPTTPARWLATVTVALAWFYTAPPLRLNYRGLGEFTAGAVLYGLGPILACFLEEDQISSVSLIFVCVVFVFQFLRMTVMNLSDVDGDREVGKRTLAVLLGEPRVIRLYAGGQAVVYAAVVVLLVVGMLPVVAGIALLCTAPVPIWVARQLFDGTWREPGRGTAVTFWSSMHMPISATAVTVGLLADRLVHGQHIPTAWLACYAATLLAFCVWLARSIGRDGRPRTQQVTSEHQRTAA
ncbi:MAG TPA: prenyltransferase [Pseudonocardiaceae bacterium]|nr:prenyltransferase [Pseudonocardiaceae bacterium]